MVTRQLIAASHFGKHARLLAGPGTGKTKVLVHRIAFLVTQKDVAPEDILVLTFTRAAAQELRQRVSAFLGPSNAQPTISTLHSFALRQLLRNADQVQALPRPLTIADDWQERHVIQEDLKTILALPRVTEVAGKLNQLSANWETLRADEPNWETSFPDPQFVGTWRQHRRVFGYTLRSELVYQLKKALEQAPEFKLDRQYKHVLVDEYQDLNLCDLAVVRAIATDAEVFGAGDDDQSIYGFRFAHPDGIRRFDLYYSPFEPLELDICQRCDTNILSLALFVADLDPKRIKKPLTAVGGHSSGEVRVLWFDDQNAEAKGIARICQWLVQDKGVAAGEILILLRSDRNRAFSGPIVAALTTAGIQATTNTEQIPPTDSDDGRKLVALLQLVVNRLDQLAWRTLLQLRDNGIGGQRLKLIYDTAVNGALTFKEATDLVASQPDKYPQFGKVVAAEKEAIEKLLALWDVNRPLPQNIDMLAKSMIPDAAPRDQLVGYLLSTAQNVGAESADQLMLALSSSMGDKEQAIDAGKINVLTMHQAKGLTADVVLVAAAEDEYLPGRQLGEEKEGDERRLLYVSLTRARHKVFITYTTRRLGQQTHTGRDAGKRRRRLTRFLTDAPIMPEPGASLSLT